MKKIFNVLVVLCAVFAVCALMACKQPTEPTEPTGPATVSDWEGESTQPLSGTFKIPWNDTTIDSISDKSTLKFEIEFYDNDTFTRFITFNTRIKPEDEDERDWEETWKLAGEYDGDANADGDIKIKMLDEIKEFDYGISKRDVSKWETKEIENPAYDTTPARISSGKLTYKGMTYKKR